MTGERTLKIPIDFVKYLVGNSPITGNKFLFLLSQIKIRWVNIVGRVNGVFVYQDFYWAIWFGNNLTWYRKKVRLAQRIIRCVRVCRLRGALWMAHVVGGAATAAAAGPPVDVRCLSRPPCNIVAYLSRNLSSAPRTNNRPAARYPHAITHAHRHPPPQPLSPKYATAHPKRTTIGLGAHRSNFC